MQKEVKVGIASLRGSYDDLLQELLKLKQQYQNIVVYTTLLDKKEQELAFAALELGIPYYVFKYEDRKIFRHNDRYWWLMMRAKKIKLLPRRRKIKQNNIVLRKRVMTMCDIVLRI